jgi:serine protease inhibitor ecotin
MRKCNMRGWGKMPRSLMEKCNMAWWGKLVEKYNIEGWGKPMMGPYPGLGETI